MSTDLITIAKEDVLKAAKAWKYALNEDGIDGVDKAESNLLAAVTLFRKPRSNENKGGRLCRMKN